MRKVAVALLAVIILSGCAKNFDKNPRYAVAMEKTFYERDKTACEMIVTCP